MTPHLGVFAAQAVESRATHGGGVFVAHRKQRAAEAESLNGSVVGGSD